ncbi:MAG: bifunctional 2-polyprenyl-6-hydroxyphenol methylase/3-demethylubiquinol 3-O-methyltransferase UbiG, partial [Deltaproteobacteria bacterium]|nr:bifunctional 2-polyprenyl-6-hydroxyphenol methylase/3-demethylubiquinol 3-O-methyltransferase UbiG [Deltaproteobacteria bacterium]
AKFATMADYWWNRNGVFKSLHDINPVRLEYICSRADLKGKSVLDVGCGGGLLTESMAAAGARVTGIDMAAPSLKVAQTHMQQSGLHIDYRIDTAERLAQTHAGRFHVVTCMELVEHVPDPASIVQACALLVRPGGDLFFATINRTCVALLLVILASEYIIGIVRKGTHTYRKLVRPIEMEKWGKSAGLTRYIPFVGYCALCRNTSMNYMMHFTKTG